MRREVACTHARARGPPDGAPMTPRRTELADGSARPRRDPGARSFARGPEEDTSKDQDLHMRRPSAGTHRCAAGTPGRHSTAVRRLLQNDETPGDEAAGQPGRTSALCRGDAAGPPRRSGGSSGRDRRRPRRARCCSFYRWRQPAQGATGRHRPATRCWLVRLEHRSSTRAPLRCVALQHGKVK